MSVLDPRIINRLETELKEYRSIVCYGTGEMAEYILPFFHIVSPM